MLLHLCTFKTPIIGAKNKQHVIADFAPQHTYIKGVNLQGFKFINLHNFFV